jgi:hypothetical protein
LSSGVFDERHDVARAGRDLAEAVTVVTAADSANVSKSLPGSAWLHNSSPR